MEEKCCDIGTLRRSEIIGGLAYLPMFLFGSQFLAVWLVMLITGSRNTSDLIAPANFAFAGLNALALGFIFRRYLLDQARRILARGWAMLGDLLLGFLIYLGLAMLASRAVALLQELLHAEYYNANQEAVETSLFTAPVFAVLSACVLAPIGEELLFRGLIFCGLYRKSRILAYALSMLLFALVHLYSSMFSQPIAVTLIALLVYLPHGFALAWTYERSGSICCCIFLHAVMNAISFLAIHALK